MAESIEKGELLKRYNLVVDELKARLGKGVDIVVGTTDDMKRSERKLVSTFCKSFLEAFRELGAG